MSVNSINLAFSLHGQGSRGGASGAGCLANGFGGHLLHGFGRQLGRGLALLGLGLLLCCDVASLLDGLDHVLPELRYVRLLADNHVRFFLAPAVDVAAGSTIAEGGGSFNINTHLPGLEEIRAPDV